MQIYNPDEKKNKYNKEKEYVGNYLKTWQCLVLFLVGLLGLSLAANFIFGPLFQSAMGVTQNSEESLITSYNTWVNFTSYVFIFLVELGLLFLFDWRGTVSKFKSVNGKMFLASLAYAGVLLLVSEILGVLESTIERLAGLNGINGNQEALNSQMHLYPAVLIVETVLLAPFVEEVTYRQGLFETIRRYSRVWAYVAVILVFGLIHTGSEMISDVIAMNNAAFTSEVRQQYQQQLYIELLTFPSYAVAGFILAKSYERNNSFLGSFFSHSIYNLLVTFITLFQMFYPGDDTLSLTNLLLPRL